jgi:hypothetical protein
MKTESASSVSVSGHFTVADSVHAARRLRRIGRARAWIGVAGALAAAAAAHGQTPLAPTDLASWTEFGASAAMHGDWMLIGAPGIAGMSNGGGRVFAFDLSDGGVVDTGVLSPSAQSHNMRFGCALALDGTSAVIGAYKAHEGSVYNCGAAYVFDREGTDWIERAKLTADDGASDAYFGYSVAMDGNLILVGASQRQEGGSSRGAVYSFRRVGDTFIQEAMLLAPDGATGDRFGFGVALSGEWGFVSAPYHYPPEGGGRGAVYIFRRISGAWHFVAKLTNTSDQRSIGGPLAVDGGLLLVGTVNDNVAHAFRLDGETWVREFFFNPTSGIPSHKFGASVALHNNRALFGDPGMPGKGSAYIYDRVGTDWTLRGIYEAGGGQGGLGESCAMGDSRFVLGAPRWNTPTYMAGQAYLYEDGSMPPAMAGSPYPWDGAHPSHGHQFWLDTVLTWSNGVDTSTVDLLLDTVYPPVAKYLDNVPAVGSFSLESLPLVYFQKYYWRIVCRNDHGETPGPIWSFTTRLAPSQFGLTADPLDFGDIPVNTTSAPASFTIHNTGPSEMTGTITPPPRYALSKLDLILPPSHHGPGEAITYWVPANGDRDFELRFMPVEAGDHAGQLVITSSDPDHGGTNLAVSGFGMPPLPGAPTGPSPVDNASNVWTKPRLSWTNGSDTATVDVYFGTSETPPKVLDGVPATETFDPGWLAYDTQYRWQVVCHNAAGSATGPLWRFTTRAAPPSLTVLAPNGGERWPTGTGQLIQWDRGSSGEAVDIDLLSRIGEDEFEHIARLAEEVANTGEWLWEIPAGFKTGDYYVAVTDAEDPMNTDRSDAAFSVEVGASLRVTSPNGGESWGMGERRDVTWTSVNAGDRVTIHLYTTINGYPQFIGTLAERAPNNGAFAWDIPSGHRPGNFYLILIEAEANPSVNDMSDAEFALIRRPSITVEAPLEGARWPVETEQVVTWRSVDVGDYVSIHLYHDGSPIRVLAAAAPNTGFFVWPIAADLVPGDLYQLQIADAEDPTVLGRSARFELTEPPIVITVSQPGEGQSVPLGSRQSVRWTSRHAGPRVTIELWASGAFLQQLEADVPNEGQWNWDVDPRFGPMADCQIRVVDAGQPEASGFSGVFELVEPPTLTVRQPNGGEHWTVGSTQQVQWSLSGEVREVMIDIYSDGQFLATLAPAVPNTGVFDWTISDAYGGKRNRLRISATEAPWVTDDSDGDFTLVAPPPGPPSNLQPNDGELDVPLLALLEWRNGAYTATSDVYLDVLYPPVERVARDLPAGTDFYLTDRLQPATRYYWRVVNKNASGTGEGPVWSFDTEWEPFRITHVEKHTEGMWLQWTPVRGALQYRVMVNQTLDEGFTELDRAPGNSYLHIGAFGYSRIFYRVEPVME